MRKLLVFGSLLLKPHWNLAPVVRFRTSVALEAAYPKMELVVAFDGFHELHPPKDVKEKPFRINFDIDRLDGQRKEIICDAMGRKTTDIIDLTAGLGRDSSVFAFAGFKVHMIERNPQLFCLLKESIARLHRTHPTEASRMSVYNVSADEFELNHIGKNGENELATSIISVYLDPMYDESDCGSKSLVKKETQILRRLIAHSTEDNSDVNNQLLLESAQRLSNERIVVKRARNAPPLLNYIPHSAILGSRQRCDIYFANQKFHQPSPPRSV